MEADATKYCSKNKNKVEQHQHVNNASYSNDGKLSIAWTSLPLQLTLSNVLLAVLFLVVTLS